MAGIGTAFADNSFNTASDNSMTVLSVADFVKIEISELPATVANAVAGIAGEAQITEAFVEEVDGVKIYKIVVTDAEGAVSELLLNEEGQPVEAPAAE